MRCALLVLFLTACSRLEPLVELDQSCHRTDVLEPGLLPQRVQWQEAQSEGDENLNALWCETVGPALFDPSPAPPADTAKVMTDSLAVISWNTHVGGGEIERLVHDLRAGRFTNGDSVRYFVLLLQEVYRASDTIPANVRIGVPSRIAVDPPSGKREDILATATRLGLALVYIPSMRNGVGTRGSREDRGNAVLSSLPLQDPLAIELPIERQRRVIAGVTVQAESTSGDSWELKLFSVHLDNRSRASRPTAMFGVARLRQARALVGAAG
jgi:endonuclease/exonuclease/phosphatase family metal-dependent hydrolase